MSILKVARMGHPVLRTRGKPLEIADIKSPTIQQLIDDMFETMKEYQGIGLAAPQVHQSLRLFVAGVDDQDGAAMPATVIINPEVTLLGKSIEEDWEGCLSVPDIRGLVPRSNEIQVKGFDRNGNRISLTADGFPARVIQHETDHVDGVLFLDRMNSFTSLTFLDEYSRYWEPSDE